MRDIRLEAGRGYGHARGNRALSRQALERHLSALLGIGVVRPRPQGSRHARETYQVNVQQLFALTEEMRVLASLDDEKNPGSDATRAAEPVRPPPARAAPHLLLAKGVQEGRRFFLEGLGPWPVGRRRESPVCLDYDPYVSGRHCVLEQGPDGIHVRDLESRNGTSVNFSRLTSGALCPLVPGDALQVGRSLLILRPPAQGGHEIAD